jgi:uncharacterized phiE125 gp8 family phage protein
MRIRMRQTRMGSPDNFRFFTYHKHHSYDVPELLGWHWLQQGIAVSAEFHILPGDNSMHYPALKRVVSPETEPLSLTDAKLFLRIDHDNEDSLIEKLIVAAREAAENYLRRSLIDQSWQLEIKGVPCAVELPRGPVQSITSVVARADNGVETTLDSSCYSLNMLRGTVTLRNLPSVSALVITYTAGFGAAGDVPHAIRQGMLMHIASLYDAREAAQGLSSELISLYAPYREIRL